MLPEQKLMFLKFLINYKSELFGRKTSNADRDLKRDCWLMVQNMCVEAGFDPLPPGKDWRYMRDKIFSNMKADTKKRLEKISEGGPEALRVKLTEIDSLVLEVLGYDPSTLLTDDDSETLIHFAATNGFKDDGVSSRAPSENPAALDVAVPSAKSDPPRPAAAKPSALTSAVGAKKRKLTSGDDDEQDDKALKELVAEKLCLQVEYLKEKIALAKRQRQLVELDIEKRRQEIEQAHPTPNCA